MASTTGFEYWQQETQLYDRPHPRLRVMARLLRRLSGRRLLDVGCSTAKLREMLPPSFVYYGCDIADHARATLPPGHFAQIDLNQGGDFSAFTAQGIEIVHVSGVLEYLERPGELLRNLRDLVEPGRTLVASIINFQSEKFSQPRSRHPAWIFQPTLEEFRTLVTESGWRIERQVPIRAKGSAGDRVFDWWLGLIGCDRAWTRRHARQFILLAQAA